MVLYQLKKRQHQTETSHCSPFVLAITLCQHLWLGWKRADPSGKQFSVLRKKKTKQTLPKKNNQPTKITCGLLMGLYIESHLCVCQSERCVYISHIHVWISWLGIHQQSLRGWDLFLLREWQRKKKRIRDKLVFSKLTHPYLQSTERKLKLLIRQKASIPLCRDLPKYAWREEEKMKFRGKCREEVVEGDGKKEGGGNNWDLCKSSGS